MVKKKKKKKVSGDVLATGKIFEGDKKIKTPKFRLSFASIFRPSSYDEGNPQYSATMLFDKESTDLSFMKKVVKKAIVERWGKASLKNKKIKRPFRDGSEKTEIDGYSEDITFVIARSKFRSKVVDKNLDEIDDESDLYSGCWCRAVLSVFTWENKKGGKGVSFGLLSIQKLKDDAAFGTSSDPDEDYGDDDLDLDDDDIDNDLEDDEEEY